LSSVSAELLSLWQADLLAAAQFREVARYAELAFAKLEAQQEDSLRIKNLCPWLALLTEAIEPNFMPIHVKAGSPLEFPRQRIVHRKVYVAYRATLFADKMMMRCRPSIEPVETTSKVKLSHMTLP
jgi:hypothetical protein